MCGLCLTVTGCGTASKVGPTGTRLAGRLCARAPPVVGGEPVAVRPLHADDGLAVLGLAKLADKIRETLQRWDAGKEYKLM